MDDLLIIYMLEEATPEESDRVQQWLAADNANRAHFERLQAVWLLAAQPNLQPATDISQALRRLKHTLKARQTARVKRIWPRVWTAAAALAGIGGVALGAYFWMKPNAPVKEQLPVVQPDTVPQKPVLKDSVQPVPALFTDTIPFAKPHKKTRPVPVTPVQRTQHKKNAAQQPAQPIDTMPVKKKHLLQSVAQPVPRKKKAGRLPTLPTDTIPGKKHPIPSPNVLPVRKHKSPKASSTPQAAVKEPPIS